MNSALGVTFSGQGRMANCFRNRPVVGPWERSLFYCIFAKRNVLEELIFPDLETLSLAKPTSLKSRLKPLSEKTMEQAWHFITS